MPPPSSSCPSVYELPSDDCSWSQDGLNTADGPAERRNRVSYDVDGHHFIMGAAESTACFIFSTQLGTTRRYAADDLAGPCT